MTSNTEVTLPPADIISETFYLDNAGVVRWRGRDRFDRRDRAFNKQFAEKPAGSKNADGYLTVSMMWEGRRRTLYAHRVAFALTFGRYPDGDVAHIDGDKTNNCPANLREASRAENKLNRGVRKDNVLGVKGVTQRGRKFEARVAIGGKSRYLGLFGTAEAASRAYAEAAAELHGDFAHGGA